MNYGRLLRSFVIGFLFVAILTALRIPFADPDHVAAIGGYAGLVLFAGFWGGLCGIIYTLTATWRGQGGTRRSAAYALMGATLGVLLFLALAADGGETLGLAGRPAGAWMSLLLVYLVGCTALVLIARKWFDILGVLDDEDP